jgi:allantoinase
MAKSGFGGTEYLLPALVSEGTKRGMGYNHMARVTSWNPAQRYGLNRKGDIAPGLRRRPRPGGPGPHLDHRRQGLAIDAGLHPVRGLELSARVEETFLRGQLIYDHARGVVGKPIGQYLHRPTA